VDPLVLLRDVREVAALANSNEPEAVTQCKRSTAHGALPPARGITERLKLSWTEVLAIAHAPAEEWSKLLGAKDKSLRAIDWLTDEHVAAILGLAAARLGEDTVSVTEYDLERRKLVTADRARWLPTPRHIVRKTGSWDEPLRVAGLKSENERDPRPRENARRRSWTSSNASTTTTTCSRASRT
jgi:tRNA nucleotidyltransferase/poly(A) polymerase